MPNPFLPNRNQDDLQDNTRKSLGAPLSGWEGIENHVMKHDTTEMKDYADDIDSLLVFAGLFSSILSGFVVATYPSLQADGTDTTNQLLALSLSLQLQATPTSIPDSMNNTITSLALSPPFAASAANRWINTLFFLSLVFSLAAALFGIFAKQWIREYLKWNSPLAAPRENILMRQIRFEAWSEWNVPAVISSIPILLEAAMLLFLSGVTILLWTLDDIVAIVVTVFVALFVAVASAFTVLPVLFHRCPYKSPTAWAIAVTASFIYSAVRFSALYFAHSLWTCYSALLRLCRSGILPERKYYAQNWRYVHKPTNSWRELDMKTLTHPRVRAGFWWSRNRDLIAAADSELRVEERHVREGPHAEPDVAEVPYRYEAPLLLKTVSETSALIRALAWVKMSSQNVQVSRYIEDAVLSARPAHFYDFSFDLEKNHRMCRTIAVSNWCILSSIFEHTPQPLVTLLPKKSEAKFTPASIWRLWHILAEDRFASSGRFTQSELEVARAVTGWGVGGVEVVEHDILALIALVDLKHVTDMVFRNKDPCSCNINRLTEFILVLSTSSSSPLQPESAISSIRTSLSGRFLAQIDSAENQHAHPDHVPMFFKMACVLGRVVVNTESMTLEARAGDATREDHEGVMLHFYRMKFRDDDDNHLQIFIHSAILWLSRLFNDRTAQPKQADMSPERTADVLNSMTHIRKSIHRRGRRTCYPYQDDEHWLLAFDQGDYVLSSLLLSWSSLRRLLHAFEKSYLQQILVGDHAKIRKSLHVLLERTHTDITQCEARDCRWISHCCDGSQDDLYEACPLLDITDIMISGSVSSLPTPNDFSGCFISSIISAPEADCSDGGPASLRPGGLLSQTKTEDSIQSGPVDSATRAPPAETSSSANAPGAQRTDAPSSSPPEQHLLSTAFDPHATSDSAQSEGFGINHGFVPRPSPQRASRASTGANGGDNERGPGRAEEPMEDTGGTMRDALPGTSDFVVSVSPAVASGHARDFALELNHAGSTSYSTDYAASAAAIAPGRASPSHQPARSGDEIVPLRPVEPDHADHPQTAADSNDPILRGGSPPVRDSARLFAGFDGQELAAGPSFEMVELHRADSRGAGRPRREVRSEGRAGRNGRREGESGSGGEGASSAGETGRTRHGATSSDRVRGGGDVPI